MEALRLWRRQLDRTAELGATLPDTIAALGGMRTVLREDSQAGAQQFYEVLLAEAEMGNSQPLELRQMWQGSRPHRLQLRLPCLLRPGIPPPSLIPPLLPPSITRGALHAVRRPFRRGHGVGLITYVALHRTC